jgi:hypothetical protein
MESTPSKPKGKRTLLIVVLALMVVAAVVAVALLPGLMNNDNNDNDEDTEEGSPTMVGSKLFGSESGEGFNAIALDQAGFVYQVGMAEGNGTVTTDGAYDTSFGGLIDIIVVKMDFNLTEVVACTYLGGNGYDRAYSIVIGPNGNVFVAGGTSSEDFPITVGAYNSTGTTINDEYRHNVFIAEFDPSLTTLVSSTYTGVVIEDPQVQIAFDGLGRIVIAGSVRAATMIATGGAYDTEYSGDIDGFIELFRSDLSEVLAATYVGGTGIDFITSMLIDDQGDVLIAAEVDSAELFTFADAFIYRLRSNLSDLKGSFQLGGPQWDRIDSMVLDIHGDVLVTGWTDGEFPVTDGSYDSVGRGETMGFVARIDGELTSIMDATYFGEGYPMSVLDDQDGNIIITGLSSEIPTTDDAIQGALGGNLDLYVAEFDPSLSDLEYATYLGGTWMEGDGFGSALGANDTIYVCGFTQSIDFPTLNNERGHVVPGESSDAVVVAIRL